MLGVRTGSQQAKLLHELLAKIQKSFQENLFLLLLFPLDMEEHPPDGSGAPGTGWALLPLPERSK